MAATRLFGLPAVFAVFLIAIRVDYIKRTFAGPRADSAGQNRKIPMEPKRRRQTPRLLKKDFAILMWGFLCLFDEIEFIVYNQFVLSLRQCGRTIVVRQIDFKGIFHVRIGQSSR